MGVRYPVLTVMTAVLLCSGALRTERVGLTGLSEVMAQTSVESSQKAETEQLRLKGEQLLKKGQFQDALMKFQQVLRLYEAMGDVGGQAATLNGIGESYEGLSDYTRMGEAYQKALTLAKKNRNFQEEGIALNGVGDIYFYQSDYTNALKVAQKALTLCADLPNRKCKALSLGNIGSIYTALEIPEKALKYFNQALSLYKTIADPRGEAYTLNNIGFIYYTLGENQKALKYYNQSILLWNIVGDQRGKAINLNNTALIYYTLKKQEIALKYFDEALLLRKEVGDRRGEANTLHNIGVLYHTFEKNEQKKRKPYCEAIIKNCREQYQEDFTKYYKIALSYYEKSLQLNQALNDRRGEAASLNNIGLVYAGFKNAPNGLGGIFGSSKSYVIRDIYGLKPESEHSIFGQKKFLETEKALGYYNRALSLWNTVGDRGGEANTLANMGSLFSSQMQPAVAIFFYKQSVNVTESLRKDMKELPQETQLAYTQTVVDIYRNLADLLLKQDRILEAQQILDLLKVQELEDYLGKVRGNAETVKGIDYLQPEQQILTQFNERQKNAIQLSNELAQLRQTPDAQRTPAQQQRIDQLVALETALNQQINSFFDSPAVTTALAQLSPTTLRQTIDLADLNALRDDLQQLNAAIIYPLILEDRLELVITTPNAPPLRRTVPVKKAEITKAILEFRLALQNPNDNSVQAQAQQLYQWLIKPLEADLKLANIQSILYAPDGVLRYIPLAALHDGKQWLAQRYRINNITAKSLDKLTPQPPQPQLNILAGAFVQGQHKFSVGSKRFDYSGLLGAGREVSQLVAAFPGTQSFLDQAFTRAAFQPRMNEHNIVHFATHAALVAGEPKDSFILFGNGDRATLRDIENWSLFNVDLVVLSACETALADPFDNGGEILGLGYIFQNRGAKATMASLWRVDDGGTEVLMNAFYSTLQQGTASKAEALRQAQLALIKGATSSANPNASLKHPYYWAPFILIGNGL